MAKVLKNHPDYLHPYPFHAAVARRLQLRTRKTTTTTTTTEASSAAADVVVDDNDADNDNNNDNSRVVADAVYLLRRSAPPERGGGDDLGGVIVGVIKTNPDAALIGALLEEAKQQSVFLSMPTIKFCLTGQAVADDPALRKVRGLSELFFFCFFVFFLRAKCVLGVLRAKFICGFAQGAFRPLLLVGLVFRLLSGLCARCIELSLAGGCY